MAICVEVNCLISDFEDGRPRKKMERELLDNVYIRVWIVQLMRLPCWCCVSP